MSGQVPPMAELDAVARAADAVLYIDDAHGTGVLGEQGRGTVLEALGSYDNTFVVGSLSKAFSCAGGFIGCPEPFHRLLKIRCAPYVFGGPVVPPYLEAIGTVIDILRSDEYPRLRARLDAPIRRLTGGLADLGLVVMGAVTPIVSVLDRRRGRHARTPASSSSIGAITSSRSSSRPSRITAGVLRIQCNANHDEAEIEGLIAAFAALTRRDGDPAAATAAAAAARHQSDVSMAAESKGLSCMGCDERGRVLLIMLAAVVALALGETALAKGMKQAARDGGAGSPRPSRSRATAGSGPA